ncbi:hypothetical protein L1887_34508 [Cichorium endivia]|nr:hypothetical protein L1887_34508 [Cichorium endivia]
MWGTGRLYISTLFAKFINDERPICPNCPEVNNKLGIRRTCIDCFALGCEIHVYQYSANPLNYLISGRSGRCTLAEADLRENVVERTLNLFHEGSQHRTTNKYDGHERRSLFKNTYTTGRHPVKTSVLAYLLSLVIGDIGLRPDSVEMSLVGKILRPSTRVDSIRKVACTMGKRKSRAKPAPRKRMDKLDTVFSCPFCNHGTSVECRIDMKNLIGEASCRICQENFSTTITALTEPIDIYSEWIDECERVNTVDDDGVPVEDDDA